MKPLACLLAFFASCASFAGAQQTWIVDAANGVGAHFLDVPPALAAASDGDTILVRAGFYSNAVTSRGVTLLGEGSPTLVAGPAGVGFDTRAVLLNGLPRGRSFVMRGFRLSGGTYSIGAEIRSCAGHVVLADLDVSTAFSGQSVQITSSADVTIVRSSLRSGASVHSSTVAFRETHCRGQAAFAWPSGAIVVYANSGLSAISSDVSICGGSFTGGAGILPGSPDQPGAAFSSCTTRIVAGRGIAFTAGAATGVPTAAIVAEAGTLDLEPSITANVSGTATITRRVISALHVAPTALGTTLTLELTTAPLDAYQLFASALVDAQVHPELGALWLDTQAYVFLRAGLADASGRASTPLAIPLDPLLRGAAIRVQALHRGALGLGLGEPTIAVLY
ncbi:MAG: hypothetical protein JNM84_25220 [Planctomycetes bacterium]|nr:hypothetical protein [Planctomycetota bacterium]